MDQKEIRYIRSRDIDRVKWDNCIKLSPNGRIYAYSFYLDNMAAQWDALLLGDYEMLMPLPWGSKMGLKYIYQPFLCAQLGLFGNGLSTDIVEAFIGKIPAQFKMVDYPLNHDNFNPAGTILRNNYLLDLNPSYELIYGNYRENIQRNIKKAYQLGCTAMKGIEVEEVIKLALSQMRAHERHAEANVERFRQLFSVLKTRQMANTYGIISDKGELISSAVFFYSHERAYYILVGNHPNGRTIGASHALIDAFIKDHAGKNIKLDFEGSDIRNLAFFYSSFGAALETYPALHLNRLPFYLKWLKK